MKKKTNTTLRVALLALTALFLLAALGGCSESQEAAGEDAALQETLEILYTCPTPFAKEHEEDFAAGKADLSADYAAALEEHFPGENFDPDYFQELCTSVYQQAGFDAYCAANGVTLTPKEVRLELTAQENGVYTFQADCGWEQSGTQKDLTLEGRVQTEDGKIVFVDFGDTLEQVVG